MAGVGPTGGKHLERNKTERDQEPSEKQEEHLIEKLQRVGAIIMMASLACCYGNMCLV